MIRMKDRTPIEARTSRQLCTLPRDNVDSGDFWIQLDLHEITIVEQMVGAAPSQRLSIPRRHFDAFVRWYTTGSKRVPK